MEDHNATTTAAALMEEASQLTFELLSVGGGELGVESGDGKVEDKMDELSVKDVREPHLQLLSTLLAEAEGEANNAATLILAGSNEGMDVGNGFGNGDPTEGELLEGSSSGLNCCNCNCSLDDESGRSWKTLQAVISCQVMSNAGSEEGSAKIGDILKFLFRTERFEELIDESRDFVMCLKCVEILKKLYELYNEFLWISVRSGGVLAKVVEGVIKLVGNEINDVPKNDDCRGLSREKLAKSKSCNGTKRQLANVVHNEGEISQDLVSDSKRKKIINAKTNSEDNCNSNSSPQKRSGSKAPPSEITQTRSSSRKNVVLSKCSTDSKISFKVESSPPEVTSNGGLDNILDLLDSTSDTCNRCGKRFKTFGGLKVHYASHVRDDNKIACKECGKKFRTSEALEMHERIDHKGYKPHKCPHDGCDRSFRLKDKLKIHIKVMHEKNKPFPCPKCEKAFRTRYHLKAHDVAQHVQGDTTIGCTQCRRKFPSKEALEIHVKTHDEEKRFVCAECHKGFKTASRLKLHEKSHDVVPSAVCPTCGKAYKHIRDLRLHEVVHEEESSYRFACGDCPRKFYRIDLLRVHQSNEKHFSQEVVGPCVSKMTDLTDNSCKEKDKPPITVNDQAKSAEEKTVAQGSSSTVTSKRKKKQVQIQKPESSAKAAKVNEPLFDCLGSPTLFPTMVPMDNVDDSSHGLEIVELTPTLTNTTAITNSLFRKNCQDMPDEQPSFILSTKDPIITNLVNGSTNIGLSAPIPQTSHYALTSQTQGIGNTIYTIKDSDRNIPSFSISAGAEQIGFDVISAFINNLN